MATTGRLSPRARGLGWLLLAWLALAAVGRSHLGTRLDGFTVDEPWHVVAGVSYVRTGDYRLNPEHPPLVKLVAGAAQSPAFVLPPFAPLVEKSQERDWVEAAMFFQNDAAAAQQAVVAIAAVQAVNACTAVDDVGAAVVDALRVGDRRSRRNRASVRRGGPPIARDTRAQRARSQ